MSTYEFLIKLFFIQKTSKANQTKNIKNIWYKKPTTSINMRDLEKVIKIVLATLFMLCLFDMPYGFYQLVRFAAMVGFAVLAYLSYQQKKETEIIIYCALALLFQPLFKIALGRSLWNIVDVLVGVGLILSIWIKTKKAS